MKLTPDEWCKKLGVQIMDPDGWRMDGAPTLETPIDQADFLGRMSMSTCRFDDWKRVADVL